MTIDLNDPVDFTVDNVRKLIASGSDRSHTQIRVSKDGIAYLSNTVGADQTDDLAFRLETFSVESDYVGEKASKDDAWVERVYKALKNNWPEPTSTYIDLY